MFQQCSKKAPKLQSSKIPKSSKKSSKNVPKKFQKSSKKATCKAAKVVKLLVDRPVDVVAQDVGGEDAPVHDRNPDCPRLLVRCIGKEPIASDQEDDVGAKECREIFKPEKLNVELTKEVDIDDHGETDQEEAKIWKHYQQLSSGLITPGSKKESKNYRRNLKTRKNQLRFWLSG